MTDFRVQYSAEAAEDLREIYRYIAFEIQAPQAARGQTDRIRKMIRSLSHTPDRFAAAEWEPWASMGMRKMPVNNYVVFYLTEHKDRTVTVIRIFYAGQDIAEIIDKNEVK